MPHNGIVPVGKVYSRINKTLIPRSDRIYQLKQYLLPVVYWTIAHYYRTPGLLLHWFIIRIAIKLRVAGSSNTAGYRQMVTLPLDSVRYFEFDFMWRSMTGIKSIERYLDISSPRMFPLLVLQSRPELKADLVNPDPRDLEATRALFDCCGISGRCSYREVLAGDLEWAPESFDLISCISVVEHIPEWGDREAIEKMWTLLKPGGRLLLSVPCAAQAFEEFIDYNEYRLLDADEKNFVFGQRFYNDALLKERVFTVTGPPHRCEVYGEKRFGICIENREAKLNDGNYPYWREPYLMGTQFAHFPTIGEMPGWGVVAMEFRKSD